MNSSFLTLRPCFGIHYFIFFWYCGQLDEEERELVAFLVSCDCKCSVDLPQSSLGWSAVYDFLVILTYLLFITYRPGRAETCLLGFRMGRTQYQPA